MALDKEQAEALVIVILGKRVGWSHEQVAALVAHLLLDRSLEERPEVMAIVEGAKRRVIREAEHLRRCEEAGEAMAARDAGAEAILRASGR